jgi:hypothetical protein
MKEARNKIAHAALISETELWSSRVFVSVHMKHRNRRAMGDFENSSECAASNACAKTLIVNVVTVSNRVPFLPDE